MISYLEGVIKFKGPNFLVILTNGVGYKVFVPINLLTNNNLSQKLCLYTYAYIKEDAFDLYGFASFEDLSLFELFLTVSGIGPKTALAIFSNGKINKIKEAIIKGNVDFFTGIPRLGRKNAQKIIIELRPKLGSLADLDLTDESSETRQIIEVLKTFGFSTLEAKEAVKAGRNTEGDTSEKIRQALKYLGKKQI